MIHQVRERRFRLFSPKIKSRKEKPEPKAPCDLEMETDPSEADQETRDPAWQKVETRKTKKKKENKKKEKEDGRSRLRTRRTRPCVLILKLTDKKSYSDILNEVKREPTLQDVGLAVARVRKTLTGDVLLILDKDNQDKTETFSEKIRVVLGGDVTINA